MAMVQPLPTYFISHGGGPWPWMKHEQGGTFDRLEQSIVDIRHELKERPKAVLLVSGHWEATAFTFTGASGHPGLIFDYYGFPPETYRLAWPAPGAPWLAERGRELIAEAGLLMVFRSHVDHPTVALEEPRLQPFQRIQDVFAPRLLRVPDRRQIELPVGRQQLLHQLAQSRFFVRRDFNH